MKVPFVDLKRQHDALQPDLGEAVQAVIDETAFISGAYADEFESSFASFLGVDHVVGCGNGTDALELALRSMGVGAGDEVIVPALTWISTSEAVTSAGARPIFADIDPETYTINPEDVARKITEDTAAILPVHLYGHPADMPALCELADAHNLQVLEDCAQAHGASLNGQMMGAWGDAAIFSFYPSKNLGAWGDAGAVATDAADIAHRARLLANHGQEEKHHHQIEGRNSRLDGLQAAVLSAKLPHLDDWNQRRRHHAAEYEKGLSSVGNISSPSSRPGAEHVYHLYVVETPRRDTLQFFLNGQGASTSVHYPTACPFQPCYADRDHVPEDFPVAHQATQRILSLPMFPEMTDAEREHVINCIQRFPPADG